MKSLLVERCDILWYDGTRSVMNCRRNE